MGSRAMKTVFDWPGRCVTRSGRAGQVNPGTTPPASNTGGNLVPPLYNPAVDAI